MTELHLAANRAGARLLFAFIFKLLFVQKLEHAFRGSGRGLDIRHRLTDLLHGTLEQAHIDHERRDNAEADDIMHRERRADDADRNESEIADERHQRHHQSAQKLRHEIGLLHRGVQTAELGFDAFIRV